MRDYYLVCCCVFECLVSGMTIKLLAVSKHLYARLFFICCCCCCMFDCLVNVRVWFSIVEWVRDHCVYGNVLTNRVQFLCTIFLCVYNFLNCIFIRQFFGLACVLPSDRPPHCLGMMQPQAIVLITYQEEIDRQRPTDSVGLFWLSRPCLSFALLIR